MGIPTLSTIQLEILRVTKQYSGEPLQLAFELPIAEAYRPPIGNPDMIQDLVDLGLIEVQLNRVIKDSSRFQRDCWHEYCAKLELPSIRAWELWREEFIASQEGSTHILAPGEDFENFSEVWIQEMRLRAVQPNEE